MARKTINRTGRPTAGRGGLAGLGMDRMSRRTIDLPDEQWVRAWIAWFGANRARYCRYADALQRVLQAAAKRYAPLAIVQARAKAPASFAGKLQRKIRKYRLADDAGRLLHPITDLCGARAITHTLDHVKAFCAFIEDHFEIDRENSVDVATRLRTNEFGYLSVHYIVRFIPGVFPTRDVPVKVPRALCGLDAEIQVRTILEHAWADITHDMTYKSSFDVPDKWQREFARLAAILEDADEAFCRVAEGLSAYAANYGAYMTEAEMREKMDQLKLVLEVDRTDSAVAHESAKLAMCAGDWGRAVKILQPFADLDRAPILRDLGVATCKHYKPASRNFRRGQKYLRQAAELDPTDSDAIASLAGTYKGTDDAKARQLYRRAFEVNPSDPYPLGNFIEYEIAARKDLSCVWLAGPSIRKAIGVCRDQADVGTNLPWAFYDMGKFLLLLGEPYQSLRTFAKAAAVSPHAWMMDAALSSLARVAAVKDKLGGYEWVRRLLVVAAAAGEARAAKTAPRSVKKLTTPKAAALRGPVVIVAGQTDGNGHEHVEAYADLLLDGFAGFKGTIIAGGTTTGVSGLVGDVGAAYPRAVRTVGYVPRMTNARISADTDKRRYREIRCTTGYGFSPLEPLQAWADILAAGVSPREVRVVGIGGGDISSVEYRLALALGATVGIVRGSGGSASELSDDPDWADAPNLIELPADAMTVRAFVAPGGEGFPPAVRETVARAIHQFYRSHRAGRWAPDEPADKPWEALSEEMRESNRGQADHILAKLADLGYAVRKADAKGRAIKKFSNSQVETMAAMEHGRWNVERLLGGWTPGDDKDPAKKISPHLVGWAELPEEIKELDRRTVRAIPDFLAEVGLKVWRKR